MAKKTVSEIMSENPIVLSEEDNLQRIAEGMEAFHLHHLPVVDGDKLVGLVSHRDILRATVSALEQGRVATQHRNERLMEETFVAHVMTRDVLTVHPQTPIAEALGLMQSRYVGCLPVVDEENRLVGIVTQNDMLTLLASLL